MAVSVASPCTSVCTYDPTRGACTGCGRTLDEIGGWPAMSDARRHEVIAAAGRRMAGWRDNRDDARAE